MANRESYVILVELGRTGLGSRYRPTNFDSVSLNAAKHSSIGTWPQVGRVVRVASAALREVVDILGRGMLADRQAPASSSRRTRERGRDGR